MSVYIQYICTHARNGEHNEKKRRHQIRKTSRTGGFPAPREPSMQDKTRQDKTRQTGGFSAPREPSMPGPTIK
eukprot:COSAG06_NODE_6240_length_3020_cov_20.570055_2_plen_73_part_00